MSSSVEQLPRPKYSYRITTQELPGCLRKSQEVSGSLEKSQETSGSMRNHQQRVKKNHEASEIVKKPQSLKLYYTASHGLPCLYCYCCCSGPRGTPIRGSWPSAQGLAQEYDCRTTLALDSKPSLQVDNVFNGSSDKPVAVAVAVAVAPPVCEAVALLVGRVWLLM